MDVNFNGIAARLRIPRINGSLQLRLRKNTAGIIQQLLQNGSTGLDALLAAVNLRVRFDAAQTLTVAEQLQARTNIGAVAAVDVGNTDTDFVVIFDGALA